MTVPIDELRCAGCAQLIRLRGNTWVHEGQPESGESWCYPEITAAADRASRARPHHLEVSWHRFGTGSESYHLVHEGVEYVLWQHPATSSPTVRPVRWSAWRVEVSTPGILIEGRPSLTVYTLSGPYRSHVTDPRQLLETMPPLVAYWLTEKVFPF